MHIGYYLLDVVETPWLEEHKRSLIFFGIIALLAIGTLIGIFIYRKRRGINNKK